MLTILKGLPISYFKDLQDDKEILFKSNEILNNSICLLYTSDAADDSLRVDLGGRRIIS